MGQIVNTTEKGTKIVFDNGDVGCYKIRFESRIGTMSRGSTKMDLWTGYDIVVYSDEEEYRFECKGKVFDLVGELESAKYGTGD